MTVVAKIKKNAFQEVWVSLVEFRGQPRLDIRLNVHGAEGSNPTTKGITVPIPEIARLESLLTECHNSPLSPPQYRAIPSGKNRELRAYTAPYMGYTLFHLRTFYNDAGSMKAGKGVAINEALLPELLTAVRLALQHLKRIGVKHSHNRKLEPAGSLSDSKGPNAEKP
jgi:hypothetical protein